MLNEIQVISAVCQYLTDKGCTNITSCTTKQNGIDIVANLPCGNGRWLVEAKGETSSKPRTPRYGLRNTLQQDEHSVEAAFFKTAQTHCRDQQEEDRLGMAFPNGKTVRKKLDSIKPLLEVLRITVFLVCEDSVSSVVEFPTPCAPSL